MQASAAVLERKRPRLFAIANQAFFDVALHVAALGNAQALVVETAKVVAVRLPHVQPISVLWEEAQKSSVPVQGAVLLVEQVGSDLQALECRADGFD